MKLIIYLICFYVLIINLMYLYYSIFENTVILFVYNCNKYGLFTAVAPNFLPLESKTFS